MSATWPSGLASAWYPVAYERDLGARPLARTLMDVPLVVFRSAAGPSVLIDRCPHRGVALSGGTVCAGALQCPYHGWRFGADGACLEVPGSTSVPTARAQSFPVIVRAGLIWTSLADEPAAFPILPSEMEDLALDRFWWSVAPSKARALDALENHLDPAHPHFLHRGLVRSAAPRRPVSVDVRLGPEGGVAVYDETGAAQSFLPRLFEGRRKTSLGRFDAPTIGQVAFHSDRGLTVAITVVFVPETRDRTRPYAHFATRKGVWPAWLKRLGLIAFHIPVLKQDQRMLARQAEGAEKFPDQRYETGPLDLLGPTIWRLAHGREQAVEQRSLTLYL